MALVPNLRNAQTAGEHFWWSVAKMCEAHGWDPAAIAAIMATETGYTFSPRAGENVWQPSRTATGLIQFIEATARGLGVVPTSRAPTEALAARGEGRSWATWTLMTMTAEQQLKLVEAYFARASDYTRPVDYYLLTWGAQPGLPLDHVLAELGQPAYEANRGLDTNNDGTITVQDLDYVLSRAYPAGWDPYPLPAEPAIVAPSTPPDGSAPPSGGENLLLALVLSSLVATGIAILIKRRHKTG